MGSCGPCKRQARLPVAIAEYGRGRQSISFPCQRIFSCPPPPCKLGFSIQLCPLRRWSAIRSSDCSTPSCRKCRTTSKTLPASDRPSAGPWGFPEDFVGLPECSVQLTATMNLLPGLKAKLRSYVLTYSTSLIALCLLPMIPKQKAQAHRRKKEWNSNFVMACLVFLIPAVCLVYGTSDSPSLETLVEQSTKTSVGSGHSSTHTNNLKLSSEESSSCCSPASLRRLASSGSVARAARARGEAMAHGDWRSLHVDVEIVCAICRENPALFSKRAQLALVSPRLAHKSMRNEVRGQDMGIEQSNDQGFRRMVKPGLTSVFRAGFQRIR